MPLDLGLEEARCRLPQTSPFVLSARSECPFEGGLFRVPFFNRVLLVTYPEGEVREERGEGQVPAPLQLLSLHYLLTADGTPIADDWIAYRHLPGAELFEGRFYNMAIRSFVQSFGHDVEGFKRAGLALGGIPMTRTGDAAFRLFAFPRIPVACILYMGDEEVAPSGTILFDASAPHYLSTEEYAYLGEYLVLILRGYTR